MNLTAKISDSAKRFLVDENDKIDFHSGFEFLLNHNGFRKGNIHTILGTSGGGKSTLVRTITADVLSNKKKKRLLLWLSEETRIEFLTEFSRSNFNDFDEDQFLIYSEMDNQSEDHLETVVGLIKENKIDILIYDNITTGSLYMDKPVREQSDAVKVLKKYCGDLNIPFVIIAHTGAQVTENYPRLIDMNDIRGSKTLVNVSQFFYIMQTIHEKNRRHGIIRIVKHRNQEIGSFMFFLKYAPPARMYAHDVAADFEEFKKIYKKRNRL